MNPDADDATRRLPVAGHLDVSRHLCTGHDTGRDPAWGTGRDLGPAGVLPAAPAALDVAGPASPSPPGAKPRFGQLTYTSFHRPDGSGGWQVKEVLGGITAEEQPPLVERVTGVEVGKLPRFLSQEEVDWLPRRLVHGPVRGAGTAYWHTVPAGLDSSGRPGNMFAHVLLDRRPETPTPPLRPSDLLRSTLWLRPFGSERVLDAALTPMEDPPSPEADYTRAAVLEFLLNRALLRTGALLGLLDAVYRALNEDQAPLVVLGVEDAADAERWIAAVCHLMSAGTSRRLYFSTDDRAAGLAAARAAGLHLAVVPCAELAGIDPGDPDDPAYVLLSDEDDAVTFVEFSEAGPGESHDQAHTTRYGSRIPATAWSALVAVVLRDGQTAAALLAQQDEIAAEVGDQGLGCGWPLAMAVLTSSLVLHTDTGDLDEALPAAGVLTRVRPPAGLVPGSPLHRAVRLARERSLGRTTAEALDAVAAPGVSGDVRAFRLGVYLERALDDRDWLVRPEGVPVPVEPGEPVGADAVARAREALDRLGAARDDGRARTTGGDLLSADDPAVLDAVEALRLLELVVDAGLVAVVPDKPNPADIERVDRMLDRSGAPLLLGATGPRLMERVGPLSERTQAAFVRPWVDARLGAMSGPVGSRLSPLLLRWLFPLPPDRPSPKQLEQPEGLAPTLLEAVAQATMVVPDPSSFRAAALAARLVTRSGDVARTALGPALPIEELAALVTGFGPEPLVPVLASGLLAAEAGPALNVVIDRIRNGSDPALGGGPAAAAVREAVELRHLATTWPQSSRDGDDPLRATARFAELFREVFLRSSPNGWTTLPDDLQHAGMAADVVDRIYRTTPPTGPPLVMHSLVRRWWENERTVREVARAVTDAVRCGAAVDLDVVLAAQVGAWQFPDLPLDRPWLRTIAQARWTPPEERPQRLLDHVVRLLLTGWRDRHGRLVEDAREMVRVVVTNPVNQLAAQHAMNSYDAFAETWWRSVGFHEERTLAHVLGRRRR